MLEHIHNEHYPKARETTNTVVSDELSVEDCFEKEIDESDVMDYNLEHYLKIKPKTSNKPKKTTHENVEDTNIKVSMVIWSETKIIV